ncbi:hypothetical protein D3C86_770950 [compost metagenome]
MGLCGHHRGGFLADRGRQLDRQESAARQRLGHAVPALARGARGVSGAGPPRVLDRLPGGYGLFRVGRRRLGARRLGDPEPAQCGRACAAAGAGRHPCAVLLGRRSRRLRGADALLQCGPAVHGGADAADRPPRDAVLRPARSRWFEHSRAHAQRPLATGNRPGRDCLPVGWPAHSGRGGAGRNRLDRAGAMDVVETLGRAARAAAVGAVCGVFRFGRWPAGGCGVFS